MRAIIDNRWIYLDNITPDVDDFLYAYFSAEDKQARFIDSVEEQSWDGVYRKYNKRDQKLSIGFLKELKVLCKKKDIPLEIENQKPPTKYPMYKEEDIDPNMLSGITLMDHQVDALKTCIKNDIGIVHYHTGAGKTEVICGIAKLLKCPTIIIAEERVVVDQIRGRLGLRDVTDDVGVFYAGKMPNDQIICVGSLASLMPPPKIKRRKNEKPEKYAIRLKGYKTRVKNHKIYRKMLLKCELLMIDECVDKDSRINTDLGLLRACDVVKILESGSNISAYVGGDFYKITDWKVKKDSETLLIETQKGRSLKTSKNHKYMVFDEFQAKEVYAKDIVVDDLLFVSDHDVQKLKINDEWYLLGLFMGDGHLINKQQIKFGIRKDVEDWKKILKSISKTIGATYKECTNNRGDTILRMVAPEYIKWLNKLGFKPGRKMGNMPDKFQIPDKNCAASLLRGLFDADGSCYENCALYNSADYNLARLTQTTLSYVGIAGSLFISSYRDRPCYRVALSSNQFQKFIKNVGFGFTRKSNRAGQTYLESHRFINAREFLDRFLDIGIKQKQLMKIINESRHILSKNNSKVGLKRVVRWCGKITKSATNIPLSYEEMKEKFGFTDKDIAKILEIHTNSVYKKRKNGKETWQLVLPQILEDIRKVAILDVPNNYSLEPVKSIEKLVSDSELIDFSVEEVHCFEANGFLVHNCDKASSNKQYRKVVRQYTNSRYVYGFTGTVPMEEDKLDTLNLTEVLGSVIAKSNRRHLEKIGRIIPVKYIMNVFGDNNRHDKSAFDIAIKELIEENEALHNNIRKITESFGDENFLILVENIKLGEALEEIIPNSVFIHGKTGKKKRDVALENFEDKKLKVLIGSKILKRGLDLKGGVDNLILAASSKKDSELEQKVGRAVRINDRGWARVFDYLYINNHYLYKHSRRRLKRMVQLGYPTIVAAPKKILDGERVIKRGFNLFRYV